MSFCLSIENGKKNIENVQCSQYFAIVRLFTLPKINLKFITKQKSGKKALFFGKSYEF